jgi:hypothetical protein
MGVTVIPSHISVAWCYVFNADVKITSIRDVGTPDHPIAAANVKLEYRLKGLNVFQETKSFDVRGDGY